MLSVLLSSYLLLSPAYLPSNNAFALYMTEEEWDACYGTSIEGLLRQRTPLTELERKRLFKEAENSARDSMIYLSKSEHHFNQIIDLKLRNICTSALVGAIGSIVIPGSRAKGISIAIAVVSNYFIGACESFWEGYDYLNLARKMASYSDSCQERLYRE